MALTIFESLEQGTPEWLEARRGIVTASTVGKLLTSTGKVASNETARTLTETLALERLTGRDRKSTRLNSSHTAESRMPSSA